MATDPDMLLRLGLGRGLRWRGGLLTTGCSPPLRLQLGASLHEAPTVLLLFLSHLNSKQATSAVGCPPLPAPLDTAAGGPLGGLVHPRCAAWQQAGFIFNEVRFVFSFAGFLV